MDNSNDPLDRLISETLKSIHSRALDDGLANSYRTLDTPSNGRTPTKRQTIRKRYQVNSLIAVAASIALVIGLGIPVLISSRSTENAKTLRSGNKIATTTTTTTVPEKQNGSNTSTTTDTLVINNENVVTTTTTKNSPTQTTTPSNTSPSFTTTTPAVVNQLARISYSNTRANDIPLDGATISGNVYIFVDDPNINSVHWWLDQPGVWDKTLATRAGSKSPQDFNYRVQPEAIVPNPYYTSALSVGEHTMGIQTRTISNQYAKVTIKFYVTR